VAVVSRCPQGPVAPLYGFLGGGRHLREMGVLLGGDLRGTKARIRLMVCLGATSDPETLRRLFGSGLR
jgi:L-asparaginase